MIENLMRKYRNMAEEMKAAVWYTVSNIIQRIAPWLVIIILTHALSTEQYGVYTVCMSWIEIIEIFVTMKVHASGYVAGLVQNEEKRGVYASTTQILSIILVSSWMIIYSFFRDPIISFTGIEHKLFLIMLFSLYGTVSIGLWTAGQRVNNKYKSVVVATIIYGLAGPVLGALTVFWRFENPIFVVILVRTMIQFIATLFFMFSNIRSKEKKWDKKIAGDVITYNLPLIPYYLSVVLLNHSDRVMIQKMCGYEDAGMYSVAYSISMIILVVSNALNMSLQVWLFKSIKKGKQGKQTKFIAISTGMVAMLVLLELLLAPEMIVLFGGRVYLEAIWVMPPVVVGVLVMFIYQQFANWLLYFKRTKTIMLISVLAAGVNIGLNFWLLPVYGYVAAGYTTLFSYLLIMILYMFTSYCIFKTRNVDYKTFFDIRVQLGILFGTIVFAAIIMYFYEYYLVRYAVVVILAVIVWINRKRLGEVLRIKQS